jgi:hypothetical protein
MFSESLILPVSLNLAFDSSQDGYFITVSGAGCKHFEQCEVKLDFI